MSKVVSLRLKDGQIERLERAARRLGRTPSETAAILLEEALRQREFPYVEFRDSAVGRQAHLKGHRLQVWWLARIAQHMNGGAADIAALYGVPVEAVTAALNYARAFPEEIAAAIADYEYALENLEHLVPGIQTFDVRASAP